MLEKVRRIRTEYSENSQAIRSISVVEAYAVVNSDAAVSESKGLSDDGLKYTFDA